MAAAWAGSLCALAGCTEETPSRPLPSDDVAATAQDGFGWSPPASDILEDAQDAASAAPDIAARPADTESSPPDPGASPTDPGASPTDPGAPPTDPGASPTDGETAPLDALVLDSSPPPADGCGAAPCGEVMETTDAETSDEGPSDTGAVGDEECFGCPCDPTACPPDCVPKCAGKACGSDGCGGSCGSCPAGHLCQNGACVCQPACGGASCAPDGCGGVCSPCPPPPNDDASRILVLTNNVENLPTPTSGAGSCAGDWMDLLYYLRTQAHRPDFFLVQQITNEAQLDALAAEMEAMLGGDYGTIIAEKDPAAWAAANCDFKAHQTKGIIYRKDRFTYVMGSKSTWRSKKKVGEGCVTATPPRYLNLVGKFTDTLAGKQLAVAGIHWPVVDGCGKTNAELTHQALKAYTGVEMYLWGGDTNLPDLKQLTTDAAWYAWYAKTNVELGQADNLGYRDAVYHHCQKAAAGSAEAATKQCLIDNGTLSTTGADPRYDFLWAKYANDYKPGDAANPPPMDGVHTIGFIEAGQAQAPDDSPLSYSDHRAVRAYVYW